MKLSRSCIYVKNYRRQLAVSQQTFADSLRRETGLNISRHQVANWELGRSQPPADVIMFLADPAANSACVDSTHNIVV